MNLRFFELQGKISDVKSARVVDFLDVLLLGKAAFFVVVLSCVSC